MDVLQRAVTGVPVVPYEQVQREAILRNQDALGREALGAHEGHEPFHTPQRPHNISHRCSEVPGRTRDGALLGRVGGEERWREEIQKLTTSTTLQITHIHRTCIYPKRDS